MRRLDGARGRILLAAALAGAFAISAVTDWRILALAGVAALAVLARGALAHLSRVARAVLPLSAGASLATLAFERLGGTPGAAAGWEPLLALNLRAALVAFLLLAVIARVDLLAALAPWPWATRLLVLALAQIHALRRLATESRLGLESRLPRRPGAREVVRGAGSLTVTLLVLSGRNARDAADALRARGL